MSPAAHRHETSIMTPSLPLTLRLGIARCQSACDLARARRVDDPGTNVKPPKRLFRLRALHQRQDTLKTGAPSDVRPSGWP